jgi:hypothetical protein
MPWTFDEIEKNWLGGPRLPLQPEDVEGAFAAAEQARGREWVLNSTFQQVYTLGKRMQSVGDLMQAITGAPGADELMKKVLQEDVGADSELEAAHFLRSRRPETEIEIGPIVQVGNRERRPDFRIRSKTASWTYVEVTQLNQSAASAGTQDALRRVASQVISILQPFLLEIVFWRDPTDGEEDELVRQACEACHAAAGDRRDVGDLASLIVKSGDPAFLIPSILPENDGTRMAIGMSIGMPGEPKRQIIVRAPFADQRAETVLTAEAKQLPKDESGLVMVDVRRQQTAFASWAKLIPPRFTPAQHTRIGGVLLFAVSTAITAQGWMNVTLVKLIPNPHARLPLPAWIAEVVEETRAESRRHMQCHD